LDASQLLPTDGEHVLGMGFAQHQSLALYTQFFQPLALSGRQGTGAIFFQQLIVFTSFGDGKVPLGDLPYQNFKQRRSFGVMPQIWGM